MAVILNMVYMKKLGLPNFSSHSCSVSLTTEIPDVSLVAQESSKLYALLQSAVDAEIKQVGFMPDATSYGMNLSQHGAARNGNGSNGHHAPLTHHRNGEAWNCTDGQKTFLQRIINDQKLEKAEVEEKAQQFFGAGVKELNKMQMSQLIDDLLGKDNGRRRWSRQPARS